MLRSPIAFLCLALAVAVNAQHYKHPFEDFSGQQFCATRQRTREGTCCANRIDECSVPIAGTLCYCDEFCENHINPDCCPDYDSYCKGILVPEPIKSCFHNGVYFNVTGTIKDNCNEW